MTAAAVNPLSTNEAWDLVAEGYAEESPAVMGPFAEQRLVLVKGRAVAKDCASVVLRSENQPASTH